MGNLSIPNEEYHRRVETVRELLSEEGSDAICLFSVTNIEWLSGFHHLQTERPVCLTVTESTIAITVPRLERQRVEDDQSHIVEEVFNYYDYPGGQGQQATYHRPERNTTPEECIERMLSVLDVESVVADMNGAPGYWGYSGPTLAELADVMVETVEWIQDLRKVKSEVEIELLKESAKWGNLAHRRLADIIEPGQHELWAAKKASLEASMAMFDALGEQYESHLRGGFPASCGFLSGPNTANPHGFTENRRIEYGDSIITIGTANVGGYITELERTMFVGDVSTEHREYFEQMLELQSLAIDACGPGVEVADVDQIVHDYCKEQNLLDYTQHHVGHNIGLEGHERGFIDRGSDEVMQPGHLYTIEPALFVPDQGGYRHSDTILITADGVERMTYYPRDLESNIIPVE